jgi:hypothetical protein
MKKSRILWDVTLYSLVEVSTFRRNVLLSAYCFAYSSALKMEAVRSFETSMNYRITWRHIPADAYSQP